MRYVLHNDGYRDYYCTWWTSDPMDQLPVDLDPRYPAPDSNGPIPGTCRNCDRRGVAVKVPPLPADKEAAAAEFVEWVRAAIREQAGKPGVWNGHRCEADVALLEWHAPTTTVVSRGPFEQPRCVQKCHECGGDPYPCRTLRMVAAPYRFSYSGHKKEWL
ncbi:hypothetical protein SAMN05421505_12012 [Sinosporangium album]|uniref:Uncharacterized protein n=1 Tax=Sinosporangium album TaxID=504805 RepID=A0A1G8EAI4_9ACTN|nr:hypothetical protein [Sinosporangium album]SDH66908.1 hypothetical protein SAMN05421505_12012 [Sinosporangium album]